MTDVPLTLAIISTITPAVAGAIPVIVGWIRDSGHDKREQAERVDAERTRLEREKRGECVKLLRLARDFRVLVENTCDARGAELTAYAKQVRQSAADISGQADQVGFMLLAAEDAASALAAEVGRLTAVIADDGNRTLGASLLSPDFNRFDRRLATFKAAAQAALGYAGAPVAEAAPEPGSAELLPG
ncbi:MAG TPA: hypothetical protein VN969_12710 [Streptosporangiaceae bacterium]|nr:hypothetical protein [Streptosporangiaceae bacterium]